MVRAYLLKGAFLQLRDYQWAAWAGKFLDEWCRHTMRSRIERGVAPDAGSPSVYNNDADIDRLLNALS